MSEKAPLINSPNMAVGPKPVDKFLVVLWPLLYAICGIALFAFFLAYSPKGVSTVYSVIALGTMLLPLLPFITSLALVGSRNKKAGKVHFWIVVAVSVLVACLILTNDRVVTSSDVDDYCAEHEFKNCIKGVDMLTDISLAVLVVSVVLGVLSAAFAQRFIEKLDIPPMPINA